LALHPILEVCRLSVTYPSAAGAVHAVREISFDIHQGETLALVGETGSGKSTLALAMLGLLDRQTRVEAGGILYEGRNVYSLTKAEWKSILGGKVGLVFQDARSALNPVLTVEDHLVETLQSHRQLSKKEARARSAELLEEVGIPPNHGKRYPFELSGGISQRVGIALAICNDPQLLIADEPTSAVDAMIQTQILDLLMVMKQRHGLSLLLISHDLALVSQVADSVFAMYHGRIVEFGPRAEVIASPAHPYTQGLIQCQPDLKHHHESSPLREIPGSLPTPGQDFSGCAFAPRCGFSGPECEESVPGWMEISKTHQAACIHWRIAAEAWKSRKASND